MSRKRILTAFILATLLAGPAALRSRAADQKTGQLVLTIRPDVLITAPATLTSTAVADTGGNQWTAQFTLPLNVKLRLAKSTTATLAIEPLLASANAATGGADANLLGEVTINGASTPINTGSPATMHYAASGTHPLAAGITLRGSGAITSASLPVRITLDSSDGALHWVSTTQLIWTAAQ